VKTFTLDEIARLTEGDLHGDPQREITGAATLAEAALGEISFFANQRYVPQLRATHASAVFVLPDFAETTPLDQIRVKHPAKAFEQIAREFAPPPIHFAPGIHPTAVIDPTAKIGERASIQPYAVIEAGVSIGDGTVIGAGTYVGHHTAIGPDSLIYPRVSIRERIRIGARAIIHPGAVIGADGFGFERVGERYQKIPQMGIVQIDDDVEIGANTTIDRARFGRTWIQQGVKLDNLVHIAHNVVVGENTVIAAQTGISGSVRIGKRVVMAGQVGAVGHIEIGDDALFGAKSGISKSVSGGSYWGSPAAPLWEAKRQMVWTRHLGKWIERIQALEEKLGIENRPPKGEDRGG
jgi:UDP-3-O-[3-hydroxymyristoyl] glucosamine N-acyltransferase